jgi:hypothetical protein
VGQTAPSGPASQPIFRFASDWSEWTTAAESQFQLQLAARYRF